ncbi:hypothetical protein HHK36_009668 [Tetracentron sinense]|uniref:Nuclease HARBI1 n=1 Tax=Tetracentron sinense TaxID=13715 RepID=A0A835DLU0_TETSI|nr:hypothetical protein HHK36_009668 [Tetracentron sinense]
MEAHDPYFVLKRNAARVIGLSSLQKVTAAMRMLAYGVAADAVDDYVRIGESTSIKSLRRFVGAVVEVFDDENLRSPNNNDISRLLAQAQESAKKDVERAFGVLQARFAIVRGPSCFWDIPKLSDIMKTCIIMHNMIVEDERDIYMSDLNYDVIDENTTVSHEGTVELSQIFQNHRRIRDKGIHSQLQVYLV